MSTIPASELVQVVPSVLSVGGSSLDVIALFLTTSTRTPIGSITSFANKDAVSDYFGPSSDEYAASAIYFGGFDGATKVPASLLFAQYPLDAVAAYLRGADVSDMTLAEIQALNQAISITVDEVVYSGTINLAAATSFSNAASLIAAGLDLQGAESASVTGSIAGTTLTISAVSDGSVAVGQFVNGTGVTAGTVITALVTGTGNTGTYTVNNSQSIGSIAMTLNDSGVTYDSVSGAFIVSSGSVGVDSTITFASGALASSLFLTEATGAVLSQGADAATPAAFMDEIIVQTTDWVTFMTMFDPDEGSGNTEKIAFADWKNTQENRYAYVCWDTDITPTVGAAPASLGPLLDDENDSGTALIWAEDAADGVEYAAFICGAAAAINFEEAGGRITFAYKAQSGILGDVTTSSVADNLGGSPQTSDRGNGYNFYGAYGAANASFVWYQRGFVTGDYAWLDSYINQIWLNNAFQIALLTLLQNTRSVPYTTAGHSLIEMALADPIAAGLNFGAFAPGAISISQAALVNAAAGTDISGVLQTQGWYLQILPASAAARAARTSPPCKFWYLDRGSIQAINLASIALQ